MISGIITPQFYLADSVELFLPLVHFSMLTACTASLISYANGPHGPFFIGAAHPLLTDTAMKTYSAKPSDIQKKWVLIDAEGLIVGRVASLIAMRLRGKHKPTYTPHMDDGDNVIVINAKKIVFTGNKVQDKVYYRHTNHPGGIKERRPFEILGGKFPERVLMKAVERMVPRGPLGRQQMTNLRIYGGAEHPHAAQNPEPLDISALNPKNAVRAR
jgi:large subunit ribosomal protein L13